MKNMKTYYKLKGKGYHIIGVKNNNFTQFVKND